MWVFFVIGQQASKNRRSHQKSLSLCANSKPMKKLLLPCLLFMVTFVQAQVNAGDDQTICIGQSTQLNGSGPSNYTYEWTSVPTDNSISDPTSLTPTITPILTTTYVYTLTGRSVSTTNLVDNGDFEDGNVGFTSSYVYSPGPNGLWNEGTYAITDDASYNHNNFTCNNDHTSNGVNFMAVNGAGQAGVEVWSQTITGITPNTEYEFSTWVASLSSISPATLQFRINGVLLGTPFTASSVTCQWNKFFEKWDSGTATSADISIINQNTATNGNDFSLDDINFSLVTYYDDDCDVVVAAVPTSDFSMDNQSCSSDTTLVTYTGSAPPTATYDWDFGAATVISGNGAGPYELQWSTAGFHNVSLSVDDICSSDTTTKSINIKLSPTASVSADATSIPYGTSTTLHGSMSGSPGPLAFEWFPDAMVEDPASQDTDTKQLEQTTLFTFMVADQTSLCETPDTITIHITGGPLNVLTLTATPDTICFGQETTLNLQVEGGSGNYSVTWTADVGPDPIETTTNILVSPDETTTYQATVTDGFNTAPTLSVEVVVRPQIAIHSQPIDYLVEVDQTASFQVDASHLLNYQWQLSMDQGTNWQDLSETPPYSGTTSALLNIDPCAADMTGNLYRCLLTGHCDPVTTTAAELTVIDAPTFMGTLVDTTICQGDTVYVRCMVENFIDIQEYQLIFKIDTSLLGFLDFINISPELDPPYDYSLGDSIGIYRDDLLTANTVSNGRIFNIGFLALEAGTTSIEWSAYTYVENSHGFRAPVFLSPASLTINPLPVTADTAYASIDSLNILDEVDIDFEVSGGSGDEVEWTTDSCGGTLVGYGNPLTLFRPDRTTSYYAKWTNDCGESQCKQVEVIVTERFVFTVPTAFTPNGDGLNDDFSIISPSTLPYFEWQIYNRWGQIVFQSNDQYEVWDGSIKGAPAPQGTYIWKATYQYRLDGNASDQHQETGMVTLIY